MITIEKALQHMAWSSQKIFEDILQLPETIYALNAAEGEWSVGTILTHFIGAAEWYKYCSTGIPWESTTEISNHEILKNEAKRIARLDEILIKQATREDQTCTFEDENGQTQVPLSVILAQTVSHTAEHRAQLSTILTMHGFRLDLDDKDVWAFNKRVQF